MSERINIVQIQTALLVPVTAQFVVNKLGVQPAETQKRLMLWNASDYPLICDRLTAWINKAKGIDITKVNGERPAAKKDEKAAGGDTGGAEDFFGEDGDNSEFF